HELAREFGISPLVCERLVFRHGSEARRILALTRDDPALAPVATRALARVSPDAGRSLGAAGVSLFGVVADGDRWREGLLASLRSDDESTARAAAEALVSRPEGLAAAARAAADDPALARLCVAAAAAVAPTAAAWSALASLGAVSADDLALLAESLPDEEAINAARAEPDPARRLMLLARFSPPAGPTDGAIPTDASAWRALTFFQLGRDAEAITEGGAVPSETFQDLFGVDPVIAASLCLGQPAPPDRPEPSPETWLSAIERAGRTDRDRAGQLIEAARRLAQDWDASVRVRLAEVEAEIEK
ncbi:MAG: hypothetical protein D6693_01545, partial [Planctomycetota bacterium]